MDSLKDVVRIYRIKSIRECDLLELVEFVEELSDPNLQLAATAQAIRKAKESIYAE